MGEGRGRVGLKREEERVCRYKSRVKTTGGGR